jgi:hypothetical protein
VIVDVLQGSGDRREEVGRVVGAVRGVNLHHLSSNPS